MTREQSVSAATAGDRLKGAGCFVAAPEADRTVLEQTRVAARRSVPDYQAVEPGRSRDFARAA